jgi:hypothetical protein
LRRTPAARSGFPKKNVLLFERGDKGRFDQSGGQELRPLQVKLTSFGMGLVIPNVFSLRAHTRRRGPLKG